MTLAEGMDYVPAINEPPLAREGNSTGETHMTAMFGSLLAQQDAEPGAMPMLFGAVFYLGILFLIFGGLWKIYTKAGKPGWASLIPFYNMIVLLEIVGRPVWWFVMLLIPCVNVVFFLLIYLDLAKSFGKGAGYGLGLFFLSPIFIPMLGFGDAVYEGPAAAENAV